METYENLSTPTKLPIWKNPKFINIGLEPVALLNQTVNELKARFALLNFDVNQRLKEKGLTPNDVTLVWQPRFDETFVTIRYKGKKYSDETIKF